MKRTLICLLVCVLLTACGGDEQRSDADRLTRAEFIARVDAICADRSNALENLDPPQNLEESERFLRRLLPVIRDQLGRIRAVGDPPDDGRQTYLQWFEARDGIVETTADMIEAAEAGDAARYQQLATLQQQLDETADEAAAAYGFEECGDP